MKAFLVLVALALAVPAVAATSAIDLGREIDVGAILPPPGPCGRQGSITTVGAPVPQGTYWDADNDYHVYGDYVDVTAYRHNYCVGSTSVGAVSTGTSNGGSWDIEVVRTFVLA